MNCLAPIYAGDVIQVSEADYCYGIGSLTLRITDVHGLLYLNDGPRVIVDGILLWPDGCEEEERYAQIRVVGIRFLPERHPSVVHHGCGANLPASPAPVSRPLMTSWDAEM